MIVWCAVVAAGAAVLVGGLAVLLGRLRLGERREKWHDQTTSPAGAMFNALFLASLALSVVIAWQSYDHAKADAAAEGSAVTALYGDLGVLPGGAALRRDVVSYGTVVVGREWPTLTESDAASGLLRDMSDRVLSLPTDSDAVQSVRQAVMRDLDEVATAREARLGDSGSRLPDGLLLCLVVTACVVLVHGTVVGSPHSTASLVPLATEAALIGAAVFVVFAIRQPFHGALTIGPDAMRQALAGFTAAS